MRGSFRRASVITTCCFLIGALSLSLPIDNEILFKSQTSATAQDGAERFFMLWWNAPLGVQALLHGVIFVTGLGIAAKLATYSEAALYFDGASLVLYILSLSLYFGVILPAMYLLTPLDTPTPWFFNIPQLLNFKHDPLPERIPLTVAERSEQLGFICAGNVLLMGVLAGIIVMQCGDWFVEAKYEQMLPPSQQQAIAKRAKKD